MLLERSELMIREGSEESFAAVMKDKGLKLLSGFEGVTSVSLGRGVENPQKFMLLVGWEAMEAHAAYSKSPVSGEFRALLGPFVTGGAMEHFEMG